VRGVPVRCRFRASCHGCGPRRRLDAPLSLFDGTCDLGSRLFGVFPHPKRQREEGEVACSRCGCSGHLLRWRQKTPEWLKEARTPSRFAICPSRKRTCANERYTLEKAVQTERTAFPAHDGACRAGQRRGAQDGGSDGARACPSVDRAGKTFGFGAGSTRQAAAFLVAHGPQRERSRLHKPSWRRWLTPSQPAVVDRAAHGPETVEDSRIVS
jgi:hypothetical protein